MVGRWNFLFWEVLFFRGKLAVSFRVYIWRALPCHEMFWLLFLRVHCLWWTAVKSKLLIDLDCFIGLEKITQHKKSSSVTQKKASNISRETTPSSSSMALRVVAKHWPLKPLRRCCICHSMCPGLNTTQVPGVQNLRVESLGKCMKGWWKRWCQNSTLQNVTVTRLFKLN